LDGNHGFDGFFGGVKFGGGWRMFTHGFLLPETMVQTKKELFTHSKILARLFLFPRATLNCRRELRLNAKLPAS
jgi:hypothetical protein